jgi:hypothetical protein
MQAPPIDAVRLQDGRLPHPALVQGRQRPQQIGVPIIVFGPPLMFGKLRLGPPDVRRRLDLQVAGHRRFEKRTCLDP